MSKISLEGNVSGSGTLTIAAPNTSTNRTLTLPDETGTIVTTGITTGLSASALSTGTLAAARLPAGSVLQVVSTNYTLSASISTTTSYTDITGMSVSITPTSATSKIFILITLAFNSPEGQSNMVILDRNGTTIGSSTQSGNGIQQFFGLATANGNNYWLLSASGSFLDSPATTSALTYKLRTRSASSTSTFYLNRTARLDASDALGSSTITAMEIAA
jgi:hypothetical protein